MIRQLVLMKFREDTPREALEAVVQGLDALPAQIPEIRSLSPGLNLRLIPSACDLALVADFETREDYRVYNNHPAHRRVLQDLITPWATDLYRAQIEVDDRQVRRESLRIAP
jgi:hypothetical protein